MRRLALSLMAVLGLCALPVAADDLPLPGDVQQTSDPYEAMVGRRPVTVRTFQTKLPLDALRAFYQKALSRRGWTVQTGTPWADQYRQRWDDFEKVKQDYAQAFSQIADPNVREQIAALEQRHENIEEGLARSLSARREQERLSLLFTPQERSTAVFVTRWMEESPAESGAGGSGGDTGAPTAAAPPQAPQSNVCCTGEAVPPEARSLPLSIPDYPGAKMVAASGPAQRRFRSAVYTSQDPRERIMDFYRQHMAYNGWTLIEQPEGQPQLPIGVGASLPTSIKMAQMAFKDAHGLCGILLTEDTLPTHPALQLKEGREPANTVIFVTYVEQSRRRPGTSPVADEQD